MTSKTKKRNKIISFTNNYIMKLSLRLISWLSACTNVPSPVHRSCLRLTEKIIRVMKHRGIAEGIKYSKSLRAQFLDLILCMDKGRIDLRRSSSVPIPLKDAIRAANLTGKDDPEVLHRSIRLIFTSLYWSRYVRLPPNPSFTTIEERSSFTDVSPPAASRMMIIRFLKELGVNSRFIGVKPKALSFKKFHMTSKSGPAGHALWSTFMEVNLLPDCLKESIRIVGGEKLYELIEKYRYLSNKIPEFFLSRYSFRGDKVVRRIQALSDKEGKTREVAIIDYYSQAALMPLHRYFQRMLLRIEQDCTHDQSKLIKLLKADPGSSYHSIDLTAATDRFPISVQHKIISIWFGFEYADHWKNIMVGYPFRFGDKEYSYGCGNPMGAYSSFNAFAISHHFLVFLACKQARRNWKKCPYMLLGDDIVIANDDVAKCYKQLLKEWEVPFNETKTHTSPHGYEFAKQVVIHETINVSPFPISALLDRSKQAMLALSVIQQEFWNKDWNVYEKEYLYTFLTDVYLWTYPRVKATKPSIALCIALIEYLNGRGTLGTALRQYVVHRTGKPSKLPDKAFDQLAFMFCSDILKITFLENRDRIVDKNNHEPLGLLAEQMVMAITSTRDGGMDCFDLIESVPFLQIYGRAEETFMKLQKHITVIPPNVAEFKGLYETVDIPLSDKGFYVRNRDVLMTTSYKAAKIVKRLVAKYPRVLKPKPSTVYDPQLGWHFNDY